MGGSLAGVQGLADTPVHVPGLAASALQTLWPLRFVSVVQGSAPTSEQRGCILKEPLQREPSSQFLPRCLCKVRGGSGLTVPSSLCCTGTFLGPPPSPWYLVPFCVCVRTPYCPMSLPNMAGSLSCVLSTGDFICCHGPPVAGESSVGLETNFSTDTLWSHFQLW